MNTGSLGIEPPIYNTGIQEYNSILAYICLYVLLYFLYYGHPANQTQKSIKSRKVLPALHYCDVYKYFKDTLEHRIELKYTKHIKCLLKIAWIKFCVYG